MRRTQAKEDKTRKRADEQIYNRTRRYVEKTLESNGAFSLSSSRSLRPLQVLCAERDTAQLARFLLEMNRHDLKGTTELLQESIRVLSDNESVRREGGACCVAAVHEERAERGADRQRGGGYLLVFAEVAMRRGSEA